MRSATAGVSAMGSGGTAGVAPSPEQVLGYTCPIALKVTEGSVGSTCREQRGSTDRGQCWGPPAESKEGPPGVTTAIICSNRGIMNVNSHHHDETLLLRASEAEAKPVRILHLRHFPVLIALVGAAMAASTFGIFFATATTKPDSHFHGDGWRPKSKDFVLPTISRTGAEPPTSPVFTAGELRSNANASLLIMINPTLFRPACYLFSICAYSYIYLPNDRAPDKLRTSQPL